MANAGNSEKWYFTKEQLENTPSRKCGFEAYKELQYRQQAANFIQDMGQRLKVSQLCINTAIVYMHRFYVFHSFTNFPWHQMAAAALFLAAKVEEQPRKLEYVIRVANICRNSRDNNIDLNSERYIAQSQDLVFNENVLLQTLGFDVAIDHPHTHVVRCCHLVRASKDLAQTSYFMASNSLHLTTMCIQYKPTVVACFCILLACKWSNWEIPLSNEKKEWYSYVDPSVTAELLEQLTQEFLVIFENCPSRLKEKIMALMAISDTNAHTPSSQSNSPFDSDPKKVEGSAHKALEYKGQDDLHKHRSSKPHDASGSRQSREQKERESKERRERERFALMSGKSILHHAQPLPDPKLKSHSRVPPSYPHPQVNREPRDILREASKDSPFGLASVREVKRDVAPKPNLQTEQNSLSNFGGGGERQRPKLDPAKIIPKQQQQQQPHVKPEPSGFDQNHVYIKSSSSTSQKVKSPFADSKSVLKAAAQASKTHYNGDGGGANPKQPLLEDVKVIKEEVPIPSVIKRPSLFSPEATPPQSNVPALSPIKSPSSERVRNYSSSSEAELRPTMKKIDQVEGFENLMRDSTIGMNDIHNEGSEMASKEVTEGNKGGEPLSSPVEFAVVQPHVAPPAIRVEHCSTVPQQTAIVNGLETNPTLISNLLKQAPTVNNSLLSAEQPAAEHKEKHSHHKSKKKKEKHKHKDRSKEDKEKKKKHKDKDREKHKQREKKDGAVEPPQLSEPIKIKIQKDKIQPLSDGIKIKIPKDKIRTEGIVDPLPQPSSGGLKIKIPKEVITNCSTSGSSTGSVDVSASRKRERDRSLSNSSGPPLKISKSAHKESQKQNGKHSYHKVPPPVVPNMSVPPPTYGMYPAYYAGYVYGGDVYHLGVNEIHPPPLPTDAPPADVPPPPPPE
ncbi:cyclin-T isoform X2 [Cylas formicarius]|uniref:cyclin-T isoform X2 n=1 Tax=Cylas formicarius TaxID=197179 RepID=UPI0029589134|nr:cyclin-T isoform X2 [Cylas formicarius]